MHNQQHQSHFNKHYNNPYFNTILKRQQDREKVRKYYDANYYRPQGNVLYNELVRNNFINLNQNELHYKIITERKTITNQPRNPYKTTKTANGEIFKQYAK